MLILAAGGASIAVAMWPSGGEGDVPVRVVGGGAGVRVPVPDWVAPGYGPVSEAPDGVFRPVLVGVGGVIVALGGNVRDDSRPAIDGEFFSVPASGVDRFDLATGIWSEAARMPFDETLAGPAALSDGREVRVVGTRCLDTRSSPLDELRCGPGSLAAVAYDPAQDSWRVLEAPDIAPAGKSRPVEAKSLFVDQGRAFFLFGGHQIWAWSSDDVWSHEADLPVEGYDGCSGGGFFAVLHQSAFLEDAPDGTQVGPPELAVFRPTAGVDRVEVQMGSAGDGRRFLGCGTRTVAVFDRDLTAVWEYTPESGVSGRVAGATAALEDEGGGVQMPADYSTGIAIGDDIVFLSRLTGTAAVRDQVTGVWSTSSAPSINVCVPLGEWLFCNGSLPLDQLNAPPSHVGYLTWRPEFTEISPP